MGVARYVNMAFVASGLLAWVVLADFFQWSIELFGPSYNSQIIGHNFRLAELIGLLIALGLTIWARRQKCRPSWTAPPLPCRSTGTLPAAWMMSA